MLELFRNSLLWVLEREQQGDLLQTGGCRSNLNILNGGQKVELPKCLYSLEPFHLQNTNQLLICESGKYLVITCYFSGDQPILVFIHLTLVRLGLIG